MKIYVKILTWLFIITIAAILNVLIKKYAPIDGMEVGVLLCIGYMGHGIEHWIDRRIK